jgi:hypothetical protein
MVTKASLFPILDHEIKQTKTRCMQNKNPTRFYCKEKIKQGYDKKTYPRLVFNILKVMRNSTFIYTYWAPRSSKFLKKL